MSTARLVRSETLSIRQRLFVESAISLGAKDSYIIFRHVNAEFALHSRGLSNIDDSSCNPHRVIPELPGAGNTTTSAKPWGNMLNEAQRDIMRGIWWTTISPWMMIVITVLSINPLGDELKTRLAPNREMRMEL